MLSMLSLSFRKYKNVVKLCYAIVVQYIVKNMVNIVLECSQGIIKAKQGYQHLIEPKAGNKCYKYLWPLAIQILLNAAIILSLVQNLVLYRVLSVLQISGSRYWFLMVTLLSPLQLWQIFTPFFLAQWRAGVELQWGTLIFR